MKKICSSKTCNENNPQILENFVKDSRYATGYQNRCKTCQKKYDGARFQKNKAKILQQSKSYYESNIVRARAKRSEWRKNHKDYSAEYGKLYRRLNPGKEQAKTRRYHLAKMNAVPKWLSKNQIQEMQSVYENCPKGFEVDHIVPLQGKSVRGLHVPWNLQYLTIKMNREKGNKY